MPEVYTLRAPENFGNSYNHRPSSVIVNNNPNLLSPYPNSNEKKPRTFYLRSEYNKQTFLNKPIKPTSPRVQHKSNYPNTHRLSPVLSNENRKSPIVRQSSYEQKPEMHYLKVEDAKTSQQGRKSPYTNNDRQQRKLNDAITNSDQQKITTYTLTTPTRENSPHIQHSSSRPVRRSMKKQPVTFDIVDENEQDRPSTIYRDAPINNRYARSSKSKASESIQRSMNKYRFFGS